MMDAVLIFEPTSDHWISPLLKRGCRHVWCAVRDDSTNVWVAIDLRIDDVRVFNICQTSDDIVAELVALGYEVEPWRRSFKRKATTWFKLNTCVSMTKRVLGIQSLAVTPNQLRKYALQHGVQT